MNVRVNVCVWSAGLVTGQLGEGGVHLVGQTLVSVLVDAQLICEEKAKN